VVVSLLFSVVAREGLEGLGGPLSLEGLLARVVVLEGLGGLLARVVILEGLGRLLARVVVLEGLERPLARSEVQF
jgi:hypothetical protein